MSPPFGGYDNIAVLLILGLTPPGYTISPRSGLRRPRLAGQLYRKRVL